jgi:periplasmic divalent cation tolerance protein
MTDYIQVVSTLAQREQATALANTLVEKRLAACAQVLGPMISTYRWEGRVETSQEWLLVVKSRRDVYRDLEQAIATAHPYDVPEILALPILAGHQGYLEWMDRELPPKRPAGT